MATAPTPEQVARLGGPRAWAAVILLTLIAAVSLLDRQIVTILAVEIKRDLHLNDSEIGLVYGTFFAIFYALFSIPLGRLADGWTRTRLISGSLVAWSIATIGCALSGGFAMLSGWRVAVAVGEAGASPAAYSLIADLFPKHRRATAFAVYGSSAALGVGLSIALGGIVVDAWNAHFPGGRGWFGLVGWQAAFVAAALPGFVFAGLILLVREPLRGISDGLIQPPEPAPFRRAAMQFRPLLPPMSLVNLRDIGAPRGAVARNLLLIAALLAFVTVATGIAHAIVPADRLKVYATLAGIRITSHTVQWSVVALGLYSALSWVQAQRVRDPGAAAVMWGSPTVIALMFVAAFNLLINYGYTAFASPFAVQTYKASLSEIGIKVGLAAAVSGGVGTILGGVVGDWARRRHPLGRVFVLLVTTIVPLPMAFVTLSQTTLDGFVFWFLASSMVLTGWFPCATATLHDLVLPRVRGTVTAVMYLGITIVGMGTGPYLVGTISDVTGNLGRAILSAYLADAVVWTALIVVLRNLQKDEATVLDRARAAGEPV